MPQKQPNVTISNYYFNDAQDYFKIFNICWQDDYLSVKKSLRGKCCFFLLLAFECALKSMYAYESNISYEKLYKKLKKYSHDIKGLSEEIILINGAIPNSIILSIEQGKDLTEKLGIKLRYSIDLFDFQHWYQNEYYQTIGTNVWFKKMSKIVKNILLFQDKQLSKHSGGLKLSDLTPDYFRKPFPPKLSGQ